MELENNVTLDFKAENISSCRVCLSSKGILHSLYKDNQESSQYYLMKCFKIEVFQDDGLPDGICSICIEELLTANRFLVKFLDSDKKLRTTAKELKLNKDEKTYEVLIEQPLIKEEYDEDIIAYNSPVESIKFEPADIEPIRKINHRKYIKKRRKIKETKEKKRKKKKSRYRSGPFFCDYCQKQLPSRSAIIIHIRTHMKEKPYACPICNRCFAVKPSLLRHISRRHSKPKKDLSCYFCGKVFNCNAGLKTHIRIHTGETPYACQFCPRQFSQVSSRIRHERIHKGEKPFACSLCERAFVDSESLTRHMSRHDDKKLFSCHICGKAVKTKLSLTIHLRLHANRKSIVCELCGFKFSTRSNHMLHMKRRHSEKSGQCELCRVHCSNLDQHMRTTHRIRESMFQCYYCEKVYHQKKSIILHIYTKHLPPKYICPVNNCHIGFATEAKLTYHTVKYHTYHSPLSCHDCNTTYFRLCDLTRHMRAKHNKLNVQGNDKINRIPS